MELIAISVKRLSNARETYIDDYNKVIMRYVEKGCIMHDYIFENDSKGKLHMHAMVWMPINIYKQSCRLSGYSYKHVNIFDEAGWIRYMNKDQGLK